MNLPEYVTQEEVQRICRELDFRDWTALSSTEVLPEEACILQEMAGAEAAQISTAAFRKGLEVELEHGLAFPDANVTNNHPVLTAKIVLAHLKEMLDYYERLEVAELEGDLFKAIIGGDAEKIRRVYGILAVARTELAQHEQAQLSS
jgi:hypothetical protein